MTASASARIISSSSRTATRGIMISTTGRPPRSRTSHAASMIARTCMA